MSTVKSNKSLLKAISIIKVFSHEKPELGPSEISREIGMPTATTHRILATLLKGGLLEKNPTTGKYRIGPEFYLIGNLYLETTDILRIADPVMETLNELTGEAVNLSMFDKGNITLVMKKESKHAFRISARIGTSMPAYSSAMGKAFLNELNNNELDKLYPEEILRPVTRKTVSNKTELKDDLKRIKKHGISYDWEGSYEGILGVAALIRDNSSHAVAGLSITLPIIRTDHVYNKRIGKLIKMAASLISYRIGYKYTTNPIRNVQEIATWWNGNKVDKKSRKEVMNIQ